MTAKLRKTVYLTAGYNTVSLGTGRSEFNPRKPRPDLDHYIREAGQGAIAQIGGAAHIDEGVIGNFMAARFNRQGHLAAMMAIIDPALANKPCTRVEAACASGGVALTTAIKSILADQADVVLAMGVEVQNTVKAIYGADYLAGAGHYASQRKEGHAYFFPGKFSDRAGAYAAKFGEKETREAMAHWYCQAIENARTCPQAQEYENKSGDVLALGKTPPNPKGFVDHLNLYDCSKVSDGASAVICASREGLEKMGVPLEKAVEIVSFGQSQNDLTQTPADLTKLTTCQNAVEKAYRQGELNATSIGVLEVHDCFSITGLLALEAGGFAEYGKARDFVIAGKTKRGGELPTNTTGGLIGFGHYTGGTGVRQAVDILRQLTKQARDSQVALSAERPYGMMINMGGDDRSAVCIICK